MNEAGHPVSLLMYGTFGAVLLILAILLVSFLRKRHHRHPMAGQRERNIEEIRREGPDGA